MPTSQTSAICISVVFSNAAITQNIISDNVCQGVGCGADPITTLQSAGVSLVGALPGTVVRENAIVRSDVAIASFYGSGTTTLAENALVGNQFGVQVWDGADTITETVIAGGSYGVVAVATVQNTTATVNQTLIIGPAASPTNTYACCGATATVVLTP